jgi:hypothetical protein
MVLEVLPHAPGRDGEVIARLIAQSMPRQSHRIWPERPSDTYAQ